MVTLGCKSQEHYLKKYLIINAHCHFSLAGLKESISALSFTQDYSISNPESIYKRRWNGTIIEIRKKIKTKLLL